MASLPRPTKRQQARTWSFLGEALGIGLSMAGNGANAVHMHHGRGPVIVAAFVPVLLFVALRIVTTAVVRGWQRYPVWAGFSLLAAVFAIVSYRDQRDLLDNWGFDDLSAGILPLGIDGLMVISAVVLLLTAETPVIEPVAVDEPPVEAEIPPVETPLALADLKEAIRSDTEALAEKAQVPSAILTSANPQPQVETSAAHGPPDQPRSVRRGVRPANATKKAFLDRLGTDDPMTRDEIVALDGGTTRSAEGKMYRWKKEAHLTSLDQ